MKNEVIYLDTEFIIDTYEEATGKKTHTSYTKTTNVNTGINLGVQLGASMRETFTYPIRTKDMYEKCKKNIEKYPTCSTLKDIGKENYSNIFWIDGLFGISKITHKNADGEIKSEGYRFVIAQEDYECDFQLIVLVDSTYFTSGYNQLIDNTSISTDTFRIKAKILVKLLGTQLNNEYIAAPLIIEKTGYFLKD